MNLPSQPSSPTTAPVRSLRAHPLAWARALEIVDGDARRLVVEEDGSVLIRNRRRSS